MEPLLLLRCVREVSLLADQAAPRTVSQRAFDDAAEAVCFGKASRADHRGLPAARQVAVELKLPWRGVLALAHEPQARQAHALGLHSREWAPKGWLTAGRVRFALRLVAGRLPPLAVGAGAVTLTMGAYDGERDALLAEDHRDWLHGRRLRLPDAEAIRLAVGDWDAALTLAGLATDVRPPRAVKQTVVSRLDVMDRFYDHYREQATKRALEAFARGNNLPMSDENKRLWSETVAEWRQRRRERGLLEPRVIQRKGGRGVKAPDYSADVGAAQAGEQSHRGKWSDEATCVAWVARYVASLTPREHSTQDGYRRWASQHPGAPSPSRFAQHGGWEAVRRAAQTHRLHVPTL